MELVSKYSGIFALLGYGILLVLWLSLRKKEEKGPEEDDTAEAARMPLDVNDEDATVACLVAAIACREEEHRNVAIRSVRRIA